jgi:hypothetical protein
MRTRLALATLALALTAALPARAAAPEVAGIDECTALTDAPAASTSESLAMSAPATVGRTVLFCIAHETSGTPVLRPATVVNDWGADPVASEAEHQHPNLLVLLDGSNDARYRQEAEAFLTAKPKDDPTVSTNPTLTGAELERIERMQATLDHAPTEAECAAGSGWRTSVAFGTGIGQWRWPTITRPRTEVVGPSPAHV